MLRLQKKLLATVVVTFVVWHLLALEDTHVVLHIACSLLLLGSLSYAIHRLLVRFLTTPPPSSPEKKFEEEPVLEVATPNANTPTQGAQTTQSTQSAQTTHKPQTVSYARAIALVAIIAVASVLRAASSPGMFVFMLSMICFACVVLLYLETVPFAVTVLIFLAAWWILCYKWLLYEICRGNTWNKTSMCYISWTYNPIVIIALVARPWIRRYGSHWKQYAFQSVILFPYVFGFLFLCAWWCLVCVNTVWMNPGPYSKGEILRYFPSNYSLGATVIKVPDDMNNVQESQYPIFFKPNQCTGNAIGISPIDNQKQALEYIRIRNNERPEKTTLMQTFHNTGGEATLFYYRYPYFSTGQLKSAWLKLNRMEFKERCDMRRRVLEVSEGPDYYYFTRDRIPTEIRYDLCQSEALVRKLDELVNSVPGLSTCRFDVKYESIDELSNGIFKIIEVDMPPFGDRAEKQKASDVARTIPNWILSIKQARTVALWVYLGFVNIVMGNTPGPIGTAASIHKLIAIADACSYRGSMSPVTPGIQ